MCALWKCMNWMDSSKQGVSMIVQDVPGNGSRMMIWPPNTRLEILVPDAMIVVLGCQVKHDLQLLSVGSDAVILADDIHQRSDYPPEVNLVDWKSIRGKFDEENNASLMKKY